MFEVLIREAAARFGVGDRALPLLQMLLAAMTGKDTGGLAEFLEKFKAAGLGPLVQSWLGGGVSAQAISNAQIETVLGTSGGLLSALTAQLNLPRDQITETIGYLLPALVGRLTPGGALPASPSAEIASYAQAGQGLLTQATQAMQDAQRTGSAAGSRKWLMWGILIIVVLAALYAWNADHHPTPVPAPAPQAIPIPGTLIQPNQPIHIQPPMPGAALGGGAPSKPASGAASATPVASAAAPAETPADATAAPASSAN